MVKWLSVIERNPWIVWRTLETYYGCDFFRPIIELDYGISDEQIHYRMKSELAKFSEKAEIETERLGKEYSKESERI